MSNSKPSPSAQRFLSHALHASLKQWIDRLPAERPDKFKELADESRNAYVRLRWVVRDLRIRLARLNPMLAQKKVLNELNQCFSNLEAAWSQYRSSPDLQWQQLDNQTEALIGSVRNLPPSDGMVASSERLEELCADMSSTITDARGEVQGLRKSAAGADKKFQEAQAKLQGLESEIQAQKARLDQMLTQHSQAFAKSEQDRAAQFAKVEQDRSAKFSEVQEHNKDKFSASLSDFEKSKSETIKKHEVAFSDIEGTSRSKSDELVSEINGQLEKAVEIVGTIVKTTMSGNYQIIANREYRNAWIMRGVAIASFLAMGGMVIWAVSSMNVGSNGIDWSTFAFRLSLGTAFLIPGLYCANGSSGHWAEEKHNRRISLELAALDPFIVKLDEAKQREIIEKMAGEYFGRQSVREPVDDAAVWKKLQFSGDQLFNLAEKIAKILRPK